MIYTGQGDAFLDFNKSERVSGFTTEGDFQKDFKVTISNANAAAQTVILFPSDAPSNPARVIKDGQIVYTVGATDLNSAGDPHSIAQFIAAILRMPTRIHTTRIESNNLSTFTRNLVKVEKRLGEKDVESRIKLEKFVDVTANNDKIIRVTDGYQLDHLTELQLEIPARIDASTPTTVTITFEMGASLDIANALKLKAKAALGPNA